MPEQLSLPGIPEKVEQIVIRPFDSKHRSVCKMCGNYINVGTKICFYGNNRFERPYIHLKCHPKYKEWSKQEKEK